MLKKRIIIGIISAVLVAGSAAAAVMYVNSKLNKIPKQDVPQAEVQINDDIPVEALTGYKNIALFGVDSRDGSLNERTDTIIIASINNDTHDIKLVSVYRDTYLNIADGEDTYTKCNSAYAKGGPKQAMEMLNMNLDLDIKDYVTVNFEALSRAVDLLGGLDLDITAEEITQINRWINETSRVSGIHTEHMEVAAEHPEDEEYTYHMDGVQVTTYARIRSTVGDDYRRTERQRYVLEKIFERVKEMDMSTLLEITDEVFPLVATNMSNADIIKLGTNALKYELTDQRGFPFNQTSKTISGKGSCVVPDDLAADVSELHKLLFDTDDYEPTSTVQAISDYILTSTSTIQSNPQDDYVPSNNNSNKNSNTNNNSNNSNTGNGGNSGGGNTDPTPDVTPTPDPPADPEPPVDPEPPTEPPVDPDPEPPVEPPTEPETPTE